MIDIPRMVRYFRVMRWGAFLTVLLVLLVGVVGVWHAVRMDADMSGCPLMAQAATLCGMGRAEHIVLWQRLFNAVPQRAVVLMLSFLALSVVLFRLRSSSVYPEAYQAQPQSYRRLALAFAPLEPLRYAFSQGILHPKICG